MTLPRLLHSAATDAAEQAHIKHLERCIDKPPEEWGSQEVNMYTTAAEAMAEGVIASQPSRETSSGPWKHPPQPRKYDLLRGFYWKAFALLVLLLIVLTAGVV